jgi:hypothetical protein
MITRGKYFFYGITALLLCSAVIFFTKWESHSGKVFIHAEPVKTSYGWGYNIYAGKRMYIKQEFIPAIQGYHGFASAADAMSVANLVITKISSNQPPTVTIPELDSLGVISDTVSHSL